MRLSIFTRRLAALGLLVAALWISWAAVAAPLLNGLAQDRENISQSRQLLARYLRSATSIPALERQRDLMRNVSSTNGFVQGASLALMSAEMQSAVQTLTASAGAVLRSSRTLPSNAENGFGRVGVELDLDVSAASTVQLLHALAVAEPAILVEKLTMRVPENGVAPLDADSQPTFNLHMRLISFSQPDRAGAPR